MRNPWAGSGGEFSSDYGDRAAVSGSVRPSVWKPGAQAVAAGGLPIAFAGGYCPLWVVGAHGGAGATSWARLLGAGDAGVSWPDPSRLTRVVVVARTHFAGLMAAQDAGIQWASGQVGRVELVGLILAADAPGRSPKELAPFRQRVAGAFPRVWLVGFQSAWRTGFAWDVPLSRDVRKVLKDMSLIGKDE